MIDLLPSLVCPDRVRLRAWLHQTMKSTCHACQIQFECDDRRSFNALFRDLCGIQRNKSVDFLQHWRLNRFCWRKCSLRIRPNRTSAIQCDQKNVHVDATMRRCVDAFFSCWSSRSSSHSQWRKESNWEIVVQLKEQKQAQQEYIDALEQSHGA